MPKSQVKVACLACRTSKTRCDGRHPCSTCLANQRQCIYRPSRRGGARRGEQYESAKKQRSGVVQNPPTSPLSFGQADSNNSLVDGIVGLIHSFGEIPDAGGLESGMSASAGLSTPCDNPRSWMIRAYRNESELLNAYYIFFHPYLPLLPLPAESRFADYPAKVSLTSFQPDKAKLPFWPTSPFGLALMAILVLVPPPGDSHPMRDEAIVLRRSYANMYAQAALESIEDFSSDRTQPSTPCTQSELLSPLHPGVPLNLEPVLALLVLGIYEYCQHGNRKKMRSRVYQALTMSMDLSLHNLSYDSSDFYTARTRAWWITMFLVYQSAIFTHSTPIFLTSDPRITTPFPEFSGCREILPTVLRAQDALLKASVLAKELTDEKFSGPCDSMGDRVRGLDSIILTLKAEIDRLRDAQPTEGADACAVQNLFLKALYLTYTARIKLHRFRAFGDYPIFLEKFCDLKSINGTPCSEFPLALSPKQSKEVDLVFPFSEQESTNICLKAALVLSRILRSTSWPNPSFTVTAVDPKPAEMMDDLTAPYTSLTPHSRYPRSLPYLACCGMQSCYVLMMLLRQIRTSLSMGNLSTCYYLLVHPEPGTERQDAERLIEELRHGVKSVYSFMASNAVFESVADMARELETVYTAHFDVESPSTCISI